MTEDNLRRKIDVIFEQSTASLFGKFTSLNEFALYDKLTYMKCYVANFKRKTAYLQGENKKQTIPFTVPQMHRIKT